MCWGVSEQADVVGDMWDRMANYYWFATYGKKNLDYLSLLLLN